MIKLEIDNLNKMYVSVIGYIDSIDANFKLYRSLNKFGVHYNNILELSGTTLEELKGVVNKVEIENTTDLTFDEVKDFVSIDEVDVANADILEIPPHFIKEKLNE